MNCPVRPAKKSGPNSTEVAMPERVTISVLRDSEPERFMIFILPDPATARPA
jgi:hypothetical protein